MRWTAAGRLLKRFYYTTEDPEALAGGWRHLEGRFPPAHPQGVALALATISANARAERFDSAGEPRRWLARTLSDVYGPRSHEALQASSIELSDPIEVDGVWSLEGLPGVGKTAILLGLCTRLPVGPEALHLVAGPAKLAADLPTSLVVCEQLRHGRERLLLESSVLRQFAYGAAVAATTGSPSIWQSSMRALRSVGAARIPVPGRLLIVEADEPERVRRLTSRVEYVGVPASGPEWYELRFRRSWQTALRHLAELIELETHTVRCLEEAVAALRRHTAHPPPADWPSRLLSSSPT